MRVGISDKNEAKTQIVNYIFKLILVKQMCPKEGKKKDTAEQPTKSFD